MRRLFLLFLAACFMFTSISAFAAEIPREAGSVVRLHVIAEDDSKEAQQLKKIVRDRVLAAAREITKGAKTPGEVCLALKANSGMLRAVARRAANEAGYNGNIRVTVGKETFPAKKYGNTLFKSGEYAALRVEIGRAEGHNWWCVIYPSLCYYGTDSGTDKTVFYSTVRTFFSRLFGGGAA